MNVPGSSVSLFHEVGARNRKFLFNSSFFETVREGTKKPPKPKTLAAPYNSSGPSTSKDEISSIEKLLSSDYVVKSRVFTRSSVSRTDSKEKSSVHDILETAGIFDVRKDEEERKQFTVSFKLNKPSQPEDRDSFLKDLLEHEPEREVLPNPEEIMLPNPEDYVTPNKKRLIQHSTASSTSLACSSKQSFRIHQATKRDFMLADVNHSRQQQSSSSLFKIPSAVSQHSSARRKHDNISVESILNTPRNYSSLPKLSTPLFNIGAYRREEGRKQSNSADTSTSGAGHDKTGVQSKTGVSSSSDPSFVIIGLASGRGCATGEVGIAVIDLKRPSIILSQYCDSQTYQKTLAKINIYQPAEILIPETLVAGNNSVFHWITNHFKDVKLVTVRRQCFNSEEGLSALRYLRHPDFASVDLIIVNKYYCLCAASAVIVYVELQHNLTFAKQSLKVEYESPHGVVTLDLETARRLELVTSESNFLQQDKYTLFGLLNNTVTLSGQRRLRSEILQPLSLRHRIEHRLDTVEYLVENEESLLAIQRALTKFANVERLLWMCSSNKYLNAITSGLDSNSSNRRPNETRLCETLTNYMLLLKQSMEEVPSLRTILAEGNTDHLAEIGHKLEDQRYETIREKISHVLHEDSRPTRGFQAAELNRCFCIKEGINGLLDAARETYSTLLDEMQELIVRYSEQSGILMGLSHTSDLGFHIKFCLPKDRNLTERPLPDILTAIKKKGKMYHASTEDIFTYNARINRVKQEIQLTTNATLLKLLEEIRDLVSCAHNLCEIVSELDVVCSLAVASCQKDYVRPIFGSELNVVSGRHPVMDKFQWNPKPNSVYASTNKNFNIVSGPNMGGKTVYILQVALLQVMAQIGCYVPATSAEFRVTDHILVRKGLIDSLQCHASSFLVEINEIMWNIKSTSDTSLIVLDEICSGIDIDEGTAIAWAICEEFLQTPAFTFLATHFLYLTNLEKLYPNVTNYQMEALGADDSETGSLVYTYRLLEGVSPVKNYGLRLLLQTAMPAAIKDKVIEHMKLIKEDRASSMSLARILDPKEIQSRFKMEQIEAFMKSLHDEATKEDFSMDIVERFQQVAVNEILRNKNCHFQRKQQSSTNAPMVEKLAESGPVSNEAEKRKPDVVAGEDHSVAGPSGMAVPRSRNVISDTSSSFSTL